MSAQAVMDASLLTDHDIFLFKQGRHFRLYEKLGAHLTSVNGRDGTQFAVWAPNAHSVSVVADFNGWNPGAHSLRPRGDGSGIWEGFIPDVFRGERYKYHIESRIHGHWGQKADPFAFATEVPPQTASTISDLSYTWGDAAWRNELAAKNSLRSPMSIYEVHAGSWRKHWDGSFWSYRDLAAPLAEYVRDAGFTHVEFMPVMEHPFYGSWGYQCTGYFAPSARQGSPQDFMFLVDTLHQAGIGVILDWVPSHFPTDGHGLGYFDGTHLYEHSDPRQGFHPDWKSFIFNYDRWEVRSFLVSSALFWMDKYHADGLRLDAVASMLYLDYSRGADFVPNEHGGRENIGAIEFLRALNEAVYRDMPDAQTIAEESTDWPMVSRPVYLGGLGFGLKWNMGWMHDTLSYFSKDAIFRKYHQQSITFSIWYAFTENFVLSLSHDEVVHGKGSLLGKMPGDTWQQFANLRLLFGYMWTHPGKKLLFMGQEFGQGPEWNHDQELRWDQLNFPQHQEVLRLIRDLNRLYRHVPALHELDVDPAGFEWVDFSDADASVVSYLRKDSQGHVALIVLNATPVTRYDYRVGVPMGGLWRELLNTDAQEYGGSGSGNSGAVDAQNQQAHGRSYSLSLCLPPLGMLVLAPE